MGAKKQLWTPFEMLTIMRSISNNNSHLILSVNIIVKARPTNVVGGGIQNGARYFTELMK
jgi:hypothetical protein